MSGPSSRGDAARLLDMLLAARRAREFAGGLSREEFGGDRKSQSAILRELTVVGEAANLVSEETRAAHPEIRWPQIVGLRNRLNHEYFRVDLDIVWTVLEQDLPQLISQLEPLVPPDD